MMHDSSHHRGRRRARTFALIGALAFATGPALADDLAGPEFGGGFAQRATIVQSGHHNLANIDQHGIGQLAQVTQQGVDNRLELAQSGQGNRAVASQQGRGNSISLDQRGDANLANIAQYGDRRSALIEQFGHRNRVDLVQGPTSPNMALRQYGDNNVATLIQH
jgi:minor curlin subunit